MKLLTAKQLKDYIPGWGCHCSAHDQSECACDADWTEKEVYRLRLVNKQLRSKIKWMRRGL